MSTLHFTDMAVSRLKTPGTYYEHDISESLWAMSVAIRLTPQTRPHRGMQQSAHANQTIHPSRKNRTIAAQLFPVSRARIAQFDGAASIKNRAAG
jgi:hypothetical protein